MNRSMIAVMAISLLATMPTVAAPAFAQEKAVEVGGAPMYPSRTIIQNAVNSKDHTTLVTAVKAAGLVETLEGAGPFTVFAPTNTAFEKLPRATVDGLLQPEAKSTLTGLLTYHVVSGKLSAADLMAKVAAGHGKGVLTTVQGGQLVVTQKGKMLMLTDQRGGMATISIADVNQSNGVIHVIDGVLMPG
ncbi:putative surface protein with fasciclin (FAS1) repeats [Nitrospirillum pindoramense]|uniref:Putative surface protein with fasciclin (FAS1) repeats n=2 Tax=Nitrospirillum amazonense TaxID=28077 RepID=A0A560GW95_9PROT|nr:putative surface protein with fasciclin (FAS1) repeats [Nitrospirillum amazonense]